MSDSDEHDLRKAIDRYLNAIRADRRAAYQRIAPCEIMGIENFSVRATLRR
jgi:hypothetical protein